MNTAPQPAHAPYGASAQQLHDSLQSLVSLVETTHDMASSILGPFVLMSPTPPDPVGEAEPALPSYYDTARNYVRAIERHLESITEYLHALSK